MSPKEHMSLSPPPDIASPLSFAFLLLSTWAWPPDCSSHNLDHGTLRPKLTGGSLSGWIGTNSESRQYHRESGACTLRPPQLTRCEVTDPTSSPVWASVFSSTKGGLWPHNLHGYFPLWDSQPFRHWSKSREILSAMPALTSAVYFILTPAQFKIFWRILLPF